METLIQVTGKRKTAVARAVLRRIKEGGKIKINNTLLENYEPKLARLKLMEPLLIAGDRFKGADISVSVKGGGPMGQAEAARLAIARLIVQHTKDKNLEKEFLEY